MKKKAIVTNTYLLQSDKEDNKGFGYIQGISYLPDYDAEIKIYVRDDKFEVESDIDNMQLLIFDSDELESINKAIQFVDYSLKVLSSLAKRDLLKDEAFIEEKG